LLIFNSSTFVNKFWGGHEGLAKERSPQQGEKPIHLRHNGAYMDGAHSDTFMDRQMNSARQSSDPNKRQITTRTRL